MRELLDELVAEIRKVYPEAVESIQPGLPRAYILERLAVLPFSVSDDVVDFYEYADGAGLPVELLPGGALLPLEDAIADSLLTYELRTDEVFRASLRFLTDFYDGGFAFASLEGIGKGQIVDLCIHAPWRPAFPNLEALLRTAITCYQRGVFREDVAGIPDVTLFYRIADELNPGFENWNST